MPLLGKVWDLRKGLHWRMPLKSSWSLGPPPAVPSPFLHGVRRLPSLTTHSQTVNHPTRLLSPNPQRKLNLCTHWTWCMYLKPQHPGGYSRKMGVLGQPGGHSKSRFQRKQRDSLRYCVTVTSLTITLRRAGLSTQPHHCVGFALLSQLPTRYSSSKTKGSLTLSVFIQTILFKTALPPPTYTPSSAPYGLQHSHCIIA